MLSRLASQTTHIRNRNPRSLAERAFRSKWLSPALSAVVLGLINCSSFSNVLTAMADHGPADPSLAPGVHMAAQDPSIPTTRMFRDACPLASSSSSSSSLPFITSHLPSSPGSSAHSPTSTRSRSAFSFSSAHSLAQTYQQPVQVQRGLLASEKSQTNTPNSIIRSMSTQNNEAKATETASAAPKFPELLDDAIVLDPENGTHKFTLIFLHGLGDHGSSFIDVFEGLTKKQIRVVLPNAPEIPITVNGGMRMPGWYDIATLGTQASNESASFDREGILKTMNKITELLDYEIHKVGSPKRVILGGFSQGAACSLLTGHAYKDKIGGIMCLSGYMILPEDAPTLYQQKDVPTLMYHGTADQIVTIARARETKQNLDKMGISGVTYLEEAGLGHSFSMREVSRISSFIQEVFAATNADQP